MKAVILSIRPEWCDRIANGEKNIELRKNKPNLETPFKCYIYCTRSKFKIYVGDPNSRISDNGKVIGEFICDRIEHLDLDSVGVGFREEGQFTYIVDLGWNTGLTFGEFVNYTEGRMIFGWHISSLIIYETPKQLSDFKKVCSKDIYCESCAMFSENSQKCLNDALTLKRPPQSWCYVQEVSEE